MAPPGQPNAARRRPSRPMPALASFCFFAPLLTGGVVGFFLPLPPSRPPSPPLLHRSHSLPYSSTSASSAALGMAGARAGGGGRKKGVRAKVASPPSLPESERTRRRKSPALWRYDLSPSPGEKKDRNTVAAGKTTTTTGQKWYPPHPPEVMAPAGGFPQLRAAVSNGADSVYVGCSSYSARARAANFDAETELPEAVRIAHASGVRLYVALNTLVFDGELSEVEDLVRDIDASGADAVIVQDLGVAKLVRRAAPRLEVHASTQQSVTSVDGVRHAARLGATRVVLGRELSVGEIDSVCDDVRSDPDLRGNGVEVETFVHGALCVSYSGQCFSSEAWGGRSANRGQCAQACRLPYGLVTDGVLTDLGDDVKYLLSPQDLCGLDHVPALVRAGVSCLKIEGRLKDSSYVAATTRAYRVAVDRAWEDLTKERETYGDVDGDGDGGKEAIAPTPRRTLSLPHEVVTKAELAQLFSRAQDGENDGLTPGFFEGPVHQRLVRGRSPRHRGLHVGRVSASASSPKRGIVIVAERKNDVDVLRTLKRGDGLVVDRGDPQSEELGGALFDVGEVTRADDTSGGHTAFSVRVKFSRDVMAKWAGRMDLVPDGAHVWRTSDAAVDGKMRRLAEAPPPPRASAEVRVRVVGSVGRPLEVTVSLPDGRVGVGRTEGLLEPARGDGLDPERISKAVGTLGDTDYALGEGGIDVSGVGAGMWCPISWVKAARRAAVEDLGTQVQAAVPSESHVSAGEDAVVESLLREVSGTPLGEIEDTSDTEAVTETRISILARTYEQVDRICQLAEEGEEIDEVIIDFLEVEGMRDAVARVREVGGGGLRAVVASPRIIKPGEGGIWRTLLRLRPDGLLIRSAGLLHRMGTLGGEGSEVNVGSGRRGDDEDEDSYVTIPPLIGDFALNAANAITAGELLSSGLARVTAALDLSASAVTDLTHLLGRRSAARIDVVAHTHLPIFHTEHCVFARFLTNGNSYLDCGHACTRHTVHLRDQSGADNLVLADMGCRNTVFASEAQSGVHSIKEWRKAGIGRVRVELVDESAADAERVVRGYLGVLSSDLRPRDVWEMLKEVRDGNGRTGGVGHGSLRNAAERRAGEVDFVSGHK